jgi:BlaI family transcriptional regulator, penicillinase repressor
MSDPGQLSKRERQIMDAVYARGEATVAQVLEGIPDPPMRGALRTLLRILEHKGHLTHRKQGREFIYRPTRPRGQAGRSALGRVLDVFFGGSLGDAVAAHLSDPRRAARLTPEELRRLSDLIENAAKPVGTKDEARKIGSGSG